MKLLAIDTAQGVNSLALWTDDGIDEGVSLPDRVAIPEITVELRRLMDSRSVHVGDLSGIAFNRGPGAFTGLRVGVAFAQGLALGTGLPLFPVSGLAALAWRAARMLGKADILPCLDARRGEIYWAGYRVSEQTPPRSLLPERVDSPNAIMAALDGTDWTVVGPGTEVLKRAGYRVTAGDPDLLPDARAIAALAIPACRANRGVGPEQALPVYLRDQVATPKKR